VLGQVFSKDATGVIGISRATFVEFKQEKIAGRLVLKGEQDIVAKSFEPGIVRRSQPVGIGSFPGEG
jgi:hypothetical protein